MSGCWCGSNKIQPFPAGHDLGACDEPETRATLAPVERIKTRAQATIFLQHIVREYLLTQLAGMRGLLDGDAVTAEDRSELGLVLNQGEAMAKGLRMANLALAAAESPVAQPFIQIPGAKLPRVKG